MSDFSGMEDLLQDFLQEANDLLSDVDNKLVDLERAPDDRRLLNDIFRGFHTIKGGAGFLNATELVSLCHLTENLFDKLRNGEMALSPELMDTIMAATQEVRAMFGELAQATQPRASQTHVTAALKAALEGDAHAQPVGNQRDVRGRADALAQIVAMLSLRQHRLQIAGEFVQIRLSRDVTNRAGHGSGAIKRTLRASDDFDPLKIEHAHIRVTRGKRDRHFVEINRDQRAILRVCEVEGAGSDAANINLVAPWARGLNGNAWRCAHDVFQARLAAPIEHLSVDRGDRHWDILDRPLSLAVGGNDDFFARVGRRLGLRCSRADRRQRARRCKQQRFAAPHRTGVQLNTVLHNAFLPCRPRASFRLCSDGSIV